MRFLSLLGAALLATASATATVGHAETLTAPPAPAKSVFETIRDCVARGAVEAPAPPAAPLATSTAPAADRPITGTPEPFGDAITGNASWLAPSEQLAGRQAALRFRFQQQMRTGARPWLPGARRE